MISDCCNTKVFSLLNLGYLSFSEKRQDPCDGKLKHKKQIDKKMTRLKFLISMVKIH